MFLNLTITAVTIKGEEWSSPIEARRSIKDLDPPDRFRIINFAKISLCCGEV
jgi:hypothetical protein